MLGNSRCGSRQQGRSITRRISKKDAGAFLKAVKRYGRIERMADIAQEVGSVLQDQPATARYNRLPGRKKSRLHCEAVSCTETKNAPRSSAGMRCGGA